MKAFSDQAAGAVPVGWVLSGIGLCLISWGVLGTHGNDAMDATTLLTLHGISAGAGLFSALLAAVLLRQRGASHLYWLALAAAASCVLILIPLLALALGWTDPASTWRAFAWFWLAERLLASIATLEFALQQSLPRTTGRRLTLPWLALGAILVALILLLDVPYPQLPDSTLARPWELLPGLLFFIAFGLLLNRYGTEVSAFGICVLLFLLLNLCVQFGFIAFSADMLDGFFRDSLILRLLAQLLLFGGLGCWLHSHLHQLGQRLQSLQRTLENLPPPPAATESQQLADTHQHVSRKVLLSLMEDFHRAREQEADAKQFADSIIENMPMMVFVKDAKDLRFQRMNKAAEQLLGAPREELLGKNDYDFFPRQQADFFTTTDRRVLAGDAVVDIPEEPLETSTGIRWLHTRKIPIRNARGNPLYLLGISEDITERRELEQRFTLLFEVAPNGLMLVRQDNSIVLVNNACCDIFGYNRAEMVNQSLHKLLPDRIKLAHVKHMYQYWGDPHTRKMSSNPNLTGIHKDGHEVPLDIALQPLPWQGELYVLAAITDITERQRFIEQLEQTNRYKTQFLANMSHELRTPMNSIIGFTEKILKSAANQLDDRSLDALQTVQRNAHHLLGLISDVLDLSKIEAGKMEVESDEVDLPQQLERLRTEFTQLAKSKGLGFHLQLPDTSVHLHTDRRKLLQICHNLISNAVKYTDHGDVTLRVNLITHPELGHCVQLQFIDTGIGIHPEDQKKLFTEFGRSAEVRRRNIQGTGLGLLISSQLVSLLGGRISAESEHGKGSVFSVTLPLNKP